MKYIVVEYEIANLIKEEMFLFPESLIHSKFFEHCVEQYILIGIKNVKAVSAGFCNASAKCFGESESLGLKSRVKDSDLIFKMKYNLNVR